MKAGEWVRKKNSSPPAIGVIIKIVCDPLDGRSYADVLWSTARARKWRTPLEELERAEGSEGKESA